MSSDMGQMPGLDWLLLVDGGHAYRQEGRRSMERACWHLRVLVAISRAPFLAVLHIAIVGERAVLQTFARFVHRAKDFGPGLPK